jgi:fumarate reductase flavoprotein subunit
MVRKSIKVIPVLLAFWLPIAGITGCTQGPEARSTQQYKAGVYTAETQGAKGKITVQTELSNDRIASVKVLSYEKETKGISDAAVNKVPGQIVEFQSLAVDAVVGATLTRNAIIRAVAESIEQAGGSAAPLYSNRQRETVNTALQTLETDVLVIGGGFSGLCAAVSAAQNGAKVLVLERQAYVGGNSLLSTAIIHMGGTDIQKAAGIQDTPQAFERDLMEAGRKDGGQRDQVQVHMVAERGNDTLKWLMSLGVSFDTTVSAGMGSPVARAHNGLPDTATVVNTVYEAALKAGVRVMLETTATDINTDASGTVTGVNARSVKGENYVVKAKNIILASGGFLADPALIKRFYGLDDLNYVGIPGVRGEMTVQAIDKLGADTFTIEIAQFSPSTHRATNTAVTSTMLSKGGILVNNRAERYVDETSGYTPTAMATLALNQPGNEVIEIFDEHTHELNTAKTEEYIELGITVQSDTIEGLAGLTGLDPAVLKKTIDDYNAAVGGAPDRFGRKVFAEPIDKAPFYAMTVTPGASQSGGGIRTDSHCRILKKDGSFIANVYAVGEIVGGLRNFGYAGGDSLAHCAVSGGLAGEEAAKNL